MTRQPVLIVVAFVAAFALLIAGGLVYLTRPYIAVSDVRTTGRPETIRGLYGRACGEDFISEWNGEESLGRLDLVLPQGGIGPEDTNATVPDNEFELTGYRYKRVQRNIFTGRTWESRSTRFDVVAWRAIVPYRTTTRDADIRPGGAPLGWRSRDQAPAFPAIHKQPPKSGC